MRVTREQAKALALANMRTYGEPWSVYRSRDEKQLILRPASMGRVDLPEGSVLVYRTPNFTNTINTGD